MDKSSIFIVGRFLAASQKKKTRDDLLTSLALTPWTTCLATYGLGDPILKHNSYHRAHEPAVLKSFSWFATTAARELVSDERITHYPLPTKDVSEKHFFEIIKSTTHHA